MPTRSWFELREIHPGVWSLSEPGHLEEVISYLVLGRDRAVLLDTGMGIGDLSAAIARLTRLPVLVVNTHADYHHCGDNHRFAEVAAHPAELPRLRQGWTREEVAQALLRHKIWRPLPPGFDPDAYHVPASPVTRPLADGEVLDLGTRRLRVLHTPGHTPGSICLLDEHTGIFFTGDTLCPSSILGVGEGADSEQLLRTLERLGGMAPEVTRVCPGHHQTPLSPDFLVEAAEAVARIREGLGRVEPAGEGLVRHRFRRFSLILPGTLVKDAPEPSPGSRARVATPGTPVRPASGR